MIDPLTESSNQLRQPTNRDDTEANQCFSGVDFSLNEVGKGAEPCIDEQTFNDQPNLQIEASSIQLLSPSGHSEEDDDDDDNGNEDENGFGQSERASGRDMTTADDEQFELVEMFIDAQVNKAHVRHHRKS